MVENMSSRQDRSLSNPGINNQERFYKVYADIGEIILQVITGECVAILCRRLNTLICGAWLPTQGYYSIRTLAALFNRSEDAIRRMLKRVKAKPVNGDAEGLYNATELPGLLRGDDQQEPA